MQSCPGPEFSDYLQSICNPSTTLFTLFTLLHEEEMLFRVEDVQDFLQDCQIPQIVGMFVLFRFGGILTGIPANTAATPITLEVYEMIT